MNRTALGRPVAVAAGALVLSAGLGACVSSGPVAYNSAAARNRVALDTVNIMEHYGMPLDDNLVGCYGPHPAPGFNSNPSTGHPNDIVCQNTVTDSPVSVVISYFSPGGSPRPGHCPGTLKVTMSGSSTHTVTVDQSTTDPCLVK